MVQLLVLLLITPQGCNLAKSPFSEPYFGSNGEWEQAVPGCVSGVSYTTT